MAPLTWREVSAPNFAGVAAAQRNTADFLSNGFDALGSALKGIQGQRIDGETSAVLADALRYTDPNAYQEALRSGTILAGRNPANISPAAFDFLANRTRSLQGNVGADLGNERSQLGNLQSGFDLLKDQTSWNRSQKDQATIDAGKSLFEKAFQSGAGTPDAVIQSLRASGAPAEVQAAAISYGQQLNPTLFGPPSANSVEALFSAAAGPGSLLSLVDQTEGGGQYNTLYGNAQRAGGAFEGVDVSKMTIGQASEFAGPGGAYGSWVKANNPEGNFSTPMGRFQIVGDTLRQTAKEMGLSEDTPFNEQTQNAMFQHLANKRISGANTMEGKISGLRTEWAGFKNVPDATLAAAITAFENGDRSALGSIAQSGGASPADPSAVISQAAGTASAGRTLGNEITLDETFRGNESVLRALRQNPYRGQTRGAIIDSLSQKYSGDSYLTPSYLNQQLDQIIADNNIEDPGIAAVILENSLEGFHDWKSGFSDPDFNVINPLDWIGAGVEALASPLLHPNARGVDRDRASTLISELIEPGTSQPTRRGVAQLEALDLQEGAKQRLAQIDAGLAKAQQDYNNALIRSATTGDTRGLVVAQQQFQRAQQIARDLQKQIEDGLATRINSLPVTKQDDKKK